MTRKILFVIPEYSHGGTNKSLENLLSLIDKSKYDISIYCLYEDGGEYYKKIFAPYVLRKSRLYYWLHDNVCTRKIMGLYNKLTKQDRFGWLYKREALLLERKFDFDTVVAYQEGTATEFVSYFNNTHKIAWIHFDYTMLNGKVDLRARKKWYDQYQQIVCVSHAAQQSMLSVHPEYLEKSTFIYNTLNTEYIEQASEDNVQVLFDSKAFNIISIGRFVSIKQFQEIPKIANITKRQVSRPFHWYIMGAGDCEEWIRTEIEKYEMQDVVKVLGPHDNPYPFIRKANLLVCTSVAESFSYVIAEAKVLHTPVLSNDFSVAYEVVNESMGWIANINDMTQVLCRIIDDIDGEYSQKKETAMNFNYSNQLIIDKIDQLLQN